jgi:hypothetical protein
MHVLTGIALFLCTSAAATLLGDALLVRDRVRQRSAGDLVFAWAAGMLAVAYAIAAVGLAGYMRAPVLLGVVALAGLLGTRRAAPLARVSASLVRRGFSALVRSPQRAVYWLLAAFLALTFLAALTPPDDRDWDGTSEHLVQAKAYVRDGLYHPLWYDHHSHFPAAIQMLFSLGLSCGSVSGAKLFHWGYGVIALAAAFLIARRHLHVRAGPWAALILLSTPAFSWLTSVAYVDLGVAAYGLLALLGFLEWRHGLLPLPNPVGAQFIAPAVGGAQASPPLQTQGAMNRAPTRGKKGETANGAAAVPIAVDSAFSVQRSAFPFLPALMAAGAMAVKMQGIALFGVLLAAFAWESLRRRTLRPVVAFGVMAGLIACPWYIKSWITTGNPVYPFAYSIFGGVQWSAEQARDYSRQQIAFGIGTLPSDAELAKMGPLQRRFVGPRTPLHLLLAPINLTFQPWAFTTNMGKLQSILFESTGPLYLALLPLFWFIRRKTSSGKPGARTVAALILWLFLILWVWWLWSMQLGRYLLPSIALITPVLGYAVAMAGDEEEGALVGSVVRCTVWAWGLLGLLGLYLVVSSALPVVFGTMSEDEYLSRACAVYTPSRFINDTTPPDAKIATYGEPRIYYIDRAAMWADPGHHRLIDYPNIKTPEQLIAAYRALGITHVLINPVFFPDPFTGQDDLHRCLREGLDKGLLTVDHWFNRGPKDYILLEVQQPPGAWRIRGEDT